MVMTMNEGFLPCGCGSTNLDIDTSTAAEIAGECFWSAWVECKTCKNYMEWEIVESVEATNWKAMMEQWNTNARFKGKLHSISEPSNHTMTEIFDDGERFVQYHCAECNKQIWIDMERGCEIEIDRRVS